MRDDASLAAVCAALLIPYRWRCFTPELVVRYVLAASDRESVRMLVATVAEAAVGRWCEIELPEPDDARVGALVRVLVSHRWRDLELTTLCTRLLAAAAWSGMSAGRIDTDETVT
jgi:hypothetical protein